MNKHVRTSSRLQGVRLTKVQRQIAQERFLKAYASTANIRAACLAAGIDRATVRQWQEHDLEFSMRFNSEAKEDANDMIRAEIWRRAVQGVEKPLVSMGKLVLTPEGEPMMYKEHSDRLLEFLARAKMPEFREKQTIDLYAEIGTVAKQAKDDLLTDLAAIVSRENKSAK